MLQSPGLLPRLSRACLCPCPPGLTLSRPRGWLAGPQVAPRGPGNLLGISTPLSFHTERERACHDDITSLHTRYETLIGRGAGRSPCRPGRVPGDPSLLYAPHGAGPARASHTGAPLARACPGGLRGPGSEGFRLPFAVPGWKSEAMRALPGAPLSGCQQGAAGPWSRTCSTAPCSHTCPSQLPTPAHSTPAPVPPPPRRSLAMAPRPASRAMADLAATSPAPTRRPAASPGRS